MTVFGWRHRLARGTVWAMLAVGPMLAAGAASAQSSADAARVGLFGFLEFSSDRLAALPLWREALARIAAEREQIKRCDADVSQCAFTAMTVWRAKVAELATLAPLERLFNVNRFVNQFPASDDSDAYGVSDHWASPLEFLQHGGDAEDFAIMTFASLRDAGIDNDRMRITVAYDALRQKRHAILVVTLDEGSYVLDTVSDAVQPAERVRYYVPYYSVNETTRWAHVVRAHRPTGG